MHPLSKFRKECKARRLRWLDVVTSSILEPTKKKSKKRRRTDSGRLISTSSDSGRLAHS